MRWHIVFTRRALKKVVIAQPMKTEYKGYRIEVTMEQKDGLWTADVWLWTPDRTGLNLISWRGAGCHGEEEAEVTALLWAKARVEIWVGSESLFC